MIYFLTLLVAATRFLPHPPNFACFGALGLFAGCYVAGRKAYWVPAAALLISDFVGESLGVVGMGLYDLRVMCGVYLGTALAVAIGRTLRGKRLLGGRSTFNLPLAALAVSTLFFVVSNVAVWIGPWYPTTAAGLVACFTNAIPFYGYTVAGDFLFSGVMFGCYGLSQSAQIRNFGSRLASGLNPAFAAVPVEKTNR